MNIAIKQLMFIIYIPFCFRTAGPNTLSPLMSLFGLMTLNEIPLKNYTKLMLISNLQSTKPVISMVFQLGLTLTSLVLSKLISHLHDNYCFRSHVRLGTGPADPPTHWYQLRALIGKPILVREGENVTGHLVMIANERLSYDMELTVERKFNFYF